MFRCPVHSVCRVSYNCVTADHSDKATPRVQARDVHETSYKAHAWTHLTSNSSTNQPRKYLMKSPLAALSALAAATLALTGCGATQSSSSSTASATSSQAASGKIEVFAAASLNNAGADLEKAYEAANPGVDITFVYEGSAKLVNQIEQGATPDLLITADTKNMDKAKKLDQFSSSETNVLVTNKLVLVKATPAKSTASTTSRPPTASSQSAKKTSPAAPSPTRN